MPDLILLVDRDDDARQIYRTYLEHQGYSVLDTADGQEGLELARAHSPDLVMGDFPLDVPGHSPFVAALRREIGCEAPVLVVSARAMDEDVLAAEAVSQGVLTKPVLPERVLEEVQRLLGSR